MSEINEKKWEEALEKIDEKYIDKAIEEMASHSEETKIAAEKSFNKGIRIAKIAGGIAASVAVIAGVGAVMNANGTKLCILHKNVPAVISTITSELAAAGLNIDNMVNKSKGESSYTVLDVDAANEDIAAKLEAIAGVRKVRIIKG